MTNVLVTYGSRHGGTRGIAERIGEVLRDGGLEAVVAPAEDVTDVRTEEAVLVGSWALHGQLAQGTPRVHQAQRGGAGHAAGLALQQRTIARVIEEQGGGRSADHAPGPSRARGAVVAGRSKT